MTVAAAAADTTTGAGSIAAPAARRPRVVLVIPRGEAVRNFVYSDALRTLAGSAEVTLLAVDSTPVRAAAAAQGVPFFPLPTTTSPLLAYRLRLLIENAHDFRLGSVVARNAWRLRRMRAARDGKRLARIGTEALAILVAARPLLRWLTRLEQRLHDRTRSSFGLDLLFARLAPDLVFNGSHIHGPDGEFAIRVAHALGIATAGFIFSWDNLTSRSRIMAPYDHYLVWHQAMKRQLLEIYRHVRSECVHVTGTPQFDYHHDPRYRLSRAELCGRLHLDPARPYVLYTAGMAHHFPEEHRFVRAVWEHLQALPRERRPQLVVRTNVKDTDDAMRALARSALADTVFPVTEWDEATHTPHLGDLSFYTSLLHHCALGINAASTVSLELLQFDKPVINLDCDPPGVTLHPDLGYPRHIRFDHYWQVASSGAVLLARSADEIGALLRRGLEQPDLDRPARQRVLHDLFGDVLDGQAGRRAAQVLCGLCEISPARTTRAAPR